MATTKRSSGGTRKSTASRSRAATTSKAASGTRSAKTRSNGRATSAKTAKPKAALKPKTAAGTSRNGATRSQARTTGSRATASRNGSARSGGSTRKRAATTQPNGTAATLKQRGTAVLHAVEKANGPALTVAAAVAGLAGGLALRQRPRISDPGIAARSRNVLRDVDPTAVLEGLGRATAELGKRSKLIARELDQVGERAERFGKILS